MASALPPEIMTNILRLVPAQARLVCKAWSTLHPASRFTGVTHRYLADHDLVYTPTSNKDPCTVFHRGLFNLVSRTSHTPRQVIQIMLLPIRVLRLYQKHIRNMQLYSMLGWRLDWNQIMDKVYHASGWNPPWHPQFRHLLQYPQYLDWTLLTTRFAHKFTLDICSRYLDYIDWGVFSARRRPIKLVRIAADLMNWHLYSSRVKVRHIPEFRQLIHWDVVSTRSDLDDDFILDNLQHLDIDTIVVHCRLQPSTLRALRDGLDWQLVSQYQFFLRPEDAAPFVDLLDWCMLVRHDAVSAETAVAYKQHIDWSLFSRCYRTGLLRPKTGGVYASGQMRMTLEDDKVLSPVISQMDWYVLSERVETFQHELVYAWVDLLDWDYISTRVCGRDFIREFAEQLNWQLVSLALFRNKCHDLLNRYYDKVNWRIISGEKPFHLRLVENCHCYLDWTVFTRVHACKFTSGFITEYEHCVDWEMLVQHSSRLDYKILKYYRKQLDWILVSRHQKLDYKKLCKFADILCWRTISEHQLLDTTSLRAFAHQLDWTLVTRNCQYDRVQLMREFPQHVNWKIISYEWTLSEDLAHEFREHLDMTVVLRRLQQNRAHNEKTSPKTNPYAGLDMSTTPQLRRSDYVKHILTHDLSVYEIVDLLMCNTQK